MPNRKRKVTQCHAQNKKPKFDGHMEWAEDKYTKNFFLPVVFHNIKSYDAHFVIKHFKKQHTPHAPETRTTMTSTNRRSRWPMTTFA